MYAARMYARISLVELVDPKGKRQGYIESFGEKTSDLIGYFTFDASNCVTIGSAISIFGSNDTAAANYSGNSTPGSKLYVYNNGTAYSVEFEDGSYVLKRNVSVATTPNAYFDLYNNHTGSVDTMAAMHPYKGRSFVVELDLKVSAALANGALISAISRIPNGEMKTNLVNITKDGTIKTGDGKTLLATLPTNEYVRISVFVDVPNNLTYTYLDGTLLNPGGATFLSATELAKVKGSYTIGDEVITFTEKDYLLTSLRIYHSYTQNLPVSFDNLALYYADSYDGSYRDIAWYEGTGIAYDGKGYFYGSTTSKWVSFDDGMRYFDEDGYMLIGEHTVDGESYTFDDRGVLTGEISTPRSSKV